MKVRVSSLILLIISALFVYSTCTFIRLQYSFYLAAFMYVVVFLWALQSGLLIGSDFLHSPLLKWFFIVLLFSILLYLHGGSYQWVTFFAGYLHIVFWTLCFEIVALNFEDGERGAHLIIHILLMAFWSFATVRAINMYPLASRAMYGNTSMAMDTSFLHSIGCGGYGFIYGLVFISIALFCKLFRREKLGQRRILYIVPIVIFGYTIIKAGFTTAIIMLLLSALLLFFYARTEKSSSGMLAIFIILIFVLAFYQYFMNLIYIIGDAFGVDIFTEKIGKISSALNASNILQLSRFNYFYKSWTSFLAHPIFGSSEAGIDSQILVQLAYMGIGGISYVGLLHSAFSVMRRYIHKQYINMLEILTLFLTLFNTFNDMTSISVVFFLTPCLMLKGNVNQKTDTTDEGIEEYESVPN